MSILRFASRSLLASFFIIDGVKAFTNPSSRAESASRLTKTAVPLAQRIAPSSVAGYIPEDPKTWVKLSGIAQLLGGISLATGVGRRFGAGVLSLTTLSNVCATRPSRGEQPSGVFLRDLALLGAVSLAAQDTEGRPGMAWRAADAKRRIAREGRKQKRNVKKRANRAKKELKTAVAS